MNETTDTRSEGRTLVVRSLSVEADGGVLVSAGAPGQAVTSHHLPISPDLASARRWQRLLRRVDRVEVDTTGERPTALVCGAGHRRCASRAVAPATALGLGLLGVPLIVRVGG